MIRTTVVLDPPVHMAALRIAMRPMDDATALIPFVLAVELDMVAGLQRRNPSSQVDIVRHQHCPSGAQLNDESLVPAAIVVVRKESADPATAFDLNVASMALERRR